ncbi:MAG: ribonuclease HI family protein [Thermoplasmata archaeon]|nr:ribonuclease HI family protein [Thermoplasmata archaeon]
MDAELPRASTVMPPIVRVFFDGACEPARGGGIATYGFVVQGEGIEHEECGLAVAPWSPRATNNVAEYTAAIRALEWLRSRRFSGTVVLMGDSQLVVRQMQGEYEVRAEHLRAYHAHLTTLSKEFTETKFAWIPRTQNTRADALSKQAIAEAAPSAQRHRAAAPVEPVEEDDPPDGPRVEEQ